MTKFISRIAAVAVIALAAVPVAAVGVANAETAARIDMSQFDLSRADDVAAFNTRVRSVERQFCAVGQTRTVADRAACRSAIRAEIAEKMSPQQRLALSGKTFSVAQR